jgi:hypothetical protein
MPAGTYREKYDALCATYVEKQRQLFLANGKKDHDRLLIEVNFFKAQIDALVAARQQGENDGNVS